MVCHKSKYVISVVFTIAALGLPLTTYAKDIEKKSLVTDLVLLQCSRLVDSAYKICEHTTETFSKPPVASMQKRKFNVLDSAEIHKEIGKLRAKLNSKSDPDVYLGKDVLSVIKKNKSEKFYESCGVEMTPIVEEGMQCLSQATGELALNACREVLEKKASKLVWMALPPDLAEEFKTKK